MIILNCIACGILTIAATYAVTNFILGFLGVKLQIKIKFLYKGNPL